MMGTLLRKGFSALGSRLAPAMTGAAIAYPVLSGDTSLGQATGETLGGVGAWNAASGWARQLPPGLPRSFARVAAPLTASLIGGGLGGTLGSAVPLYHRARSPDVTETSKVASTYGTLQPGRTGMEKIAEMAKEAEVRGVLAAFVDQGLLKVASAEAFDELAGKVAAVIAPDGYTIEDIAAATDSLLTSGFSEKTAAEQDDTARKAALGDLLMMKMAGEIDDATFSKEAGLLVTAASGNLPALSGNRTPAEIAKKMSRKIPTKALLGAGLGLGLLGGGLLGKNLYEKHKARQTSEQR